MELSADTLEVLKFLDEVTGGNLRKRNDIGSILEIGAETGNHALVVDIIFTGSSLWNLNQAISKSGSNTDGMDKLFDEYRQTALILDDKIRELIVSFENPDVKRFNGIYLAKTSGAFKNLIDLAHDLAKLKEVQTTLKSEQAKNK